jgi:hypothetical protein
MNIVFRNLPPSLIALALALVLSVAGCGRESTLAVRIEGVEGDSIPLRFSVWEQCGRSLARRDFEAARLPGTIVVRGLPAERRLILTAGGGDGAAARRLGGGDPGERGADGGHLDARRALPRRRR